VKEDHRRRMLNCDKIIYRDATHYYTEYSSIVPDRDSLSVVRQECLCSKRCLWPELMTSRKGAEPPNKKKNLVYTSDFEVRFRTQCTRESEGSGQVHSVHICTRK
jgi:hypothetical protein